MRRVDPMYWPQLVMRPAMGDQPLAPCDGVKEGGTDTSGG
jgi:hypothetical protein